MKYGVQICYDDVWYWIVNETKCPRMCDTLEEAERVSNTFNRAIVVPIETNIAKLFSTKGINSFK